MDNWKQPSIVIIALRVKLLEINLRGLYIIHFREIKDLINGVMYHVRGSEDSILLILQLTY